MSSDVCLRYFIDIALTSDSEFGPQSRWEYPMKCYSNKFINRHSLWKNSVLDLLFKIFLIWDIRVRIWKSHFYAPFLPITLCVDEIYSTFLKICYTKKSNINTLRPRQDGRHFAEDISTCIFFNVNCCILITFSLKYIRKGQIDNKISNGSANGLAPVRRQAIIWTNDG